MRAVVQRVSNASVSVDRENLQTVVGHIDSGVLVYLGVAQTDTVDDAKYLAEKIANLRIFMDTDQKMNLSVLDLGYQALVISQFTLLADARKGRRPSFSEAAPNDKALGLYDAFCNELKQKGVEVQRGVFGAIMRVSYTNEGPITILLDSKKLF